MGAVHISLRSYLSVTFATAFFSSFLAFLD